MNKKVCTNPYLGQRESSVVVEMSKLMAVIAQAWNLRAAAEAASVHVSFRNTQNVLEDFANQLSDSISDLEHTDEQMDRAVGEHEARLDARHERSLSAGSGQV